MTLVKVKVSSVETSAALIRKATKNRTAETMTGTMADTMAVLPDG
ncbi:hypothetical protein ABZV31_19160 [Streptomyces sp. NPDC005202]